VSKTELEDDDDDHREANYVGTKLTHLLKYLRHIQARDEDDSDTRVLIFSCFSGMLKHISDYLSRNGITPLFCQGNVYVRRKMIDCFQLQEEVDHGLPSRKKKKKGSAGQTKVMMLSLENAASGTNLTRATHVILFEPAGGTRAQANAADAQAIGRAHRQGGGGRKFPLKVVRFVMKDTVEEELYLRNCCEGFDS